MVSSTTVRVFQAIACICLTSIISAKEYHAADFDKLFKKWVEEKGREVNREVSWSEAYGNQKHLKETKKYHKYKVTASTRNIRYGNITSLKDKPETVYTNWYCNTQKNNSIKTKITREIKKTETFSWKVEKGIKIETELTASFTIPIVNVGTSASLTNEVDFRSANSTTKQKEETLNINYDLVIEPQTAVKAEWIITERDIEIPFTADIFIEGWVAVWYEKKYKNHWLYFYKVGVMAAGEFRRTDTNDLVYRSSGVFRGVRGHDSIIKTSEFRVTNGNCDPNSFHNSSTVKAFSLFTQKMI